MTISITKNPHPLSAEKRAEQLVEPGFGRYFTDHMVSAEWSAESGWGELALVPYGPLSLDPASMVLHYGQEIFEGLKAYRQPDNSIALFRPEANAARFARSAARMALPELPAEMFLESIEALEQYFSNVFASNPNVEKDTFRLKVVHLKYKNIDITPFSDWVHYRFAQFNDIIRYSKSHVLTQQSWYEAMLFTKDACNLSLSDE